ncbi:dihydrofolate reductase family protein [Microbacterium sp.]|uniref:dihydrofolate reductase family protein n=1 Tax=Microbacterium sp. TaxID=51671 RepID=UPI00281289F4|nr:dihydrofolate reductase family protein [Microbacterium sp.]
MAKLINSTYITLDGIIKDPQNWPSLGSFSDEGNRVQIELLEQCDAVVMGRHTYEGFVPVWSKLSGDPFSDRINALPKYVASTTLTDPTWQNTTVLRENAVDAIRELRKKEGGDIVQYGFGDLSRDLLAAGILDELRLWVHPFLLGTGTSDDLLYRTGVSGSFDLTDSTVLSSGIIILTFAAKESEG